jgi:hypothetical protein
MAYTVESLFSFLKSTSQGKSGDCGAWGDLALLTRFFATWPEKRNSKTTNLREAQTEFRFSFFFMQ